MVVAVLQAGTFVTANVDLAPGPSPCGSGQLDPGESCDDGNRFSGDGCDYLCRNETTADAATGAEVGAGGAGAWDVGMGAGGAIGTGGAPGTGGMVTPRDGAETPSGHGGSAGSDGPPADAPLAPEDALLANTGGTTAVGGAGMGGAGTGGRTGTGGVAGSGGKSGTGGTWQPGSIDCTDVSSETRTITEQYGTAQISLDGNAKKTYYFMANWWGSPYNGQSETIDGLGFTIKSPSSTPSSNKNPLGFPTLFIGTYGTRATQGSGLPKQASSLTSVPTIFSTNVDTKGISNYNAAYDLWLTQGGNLVTGVSPGPGGAYLMVWLFTPSDRRPRGTLVAGGSPVSGVKGGWDIWYDSTDPACVSYVSSSKLSSLEFDLNSFIQDAVRNGYGVKASQYLSIIFAGFEVWGGGDGLQIKKFCANVK